MKFMSKRTVSFLLAIGLTLSVAVADDKQGGNAASLFERAVAAQTKKAYGEAETHYRALIKQLARFAPGIATEQGMVYAPAAEWLSPRVRIEPHFRVTGVDGLWCVGDGSGRTSGVLPAAASGVVAAIQIAADSKQSELTWGLL